jgi:hypothetical protein
MASTIIADLNFGGKVRCHSGLWKIFVVPDRITEMRYDGFDRWRRPSGGFGLTSLQPLRGLLLLPLPNPRLAPLRQAQGRLWAAFWRRFAARIDGRTPLELPELILIRRRPV